MTGLVRRFSRRRNMSSSRTHCCYIIIGAEFKGKHTLEQDELLCCIIISSVLQGRKKTLVLFSSLRTLDPFLLLGDPRLLINLPKNWLSQDHVTHTHKQTKTQYTGKAWDWGAGRQGAVGVERAALRSVHGHVWHCAAVLHSPVPEGLEGVQARVHTGSRLTHTQARALSTFL